MADRSVSVTLKANVASFMASMRAASRSVEDFTTRNRAEMETVGRGLLGIGTAAIGGLGLATKAAIDWESAWAGVTKTVDGTEQQLASLEDELRQMATELPASHEEIAAVAEAAGQLGVSVGDVSEFTRVMIDLGETTNLTADQAATAIARFSNIMGTAQSDVDRLGSTLVDLGNNSETTEAEILELSTRLAAAGQIAGLSESDVLGFAAAVTSVGVPAEAAGTALSKTFTKIRDAVLDGSEALDTFAEVAGVSAEDFAASFREDPAAAIAQFIGGLGEMNDAGQTTTGVLEELELTDERLKRTLLSTASAGDLLTDSLELGAAAWEENTALTKEAEKRYETASAQITMAWNSIRDAAIEVGSVIAPIVADIAGAIGDLAGQFSDLPEGVDIAVAALLGLVGIAGTAGGALLLFLPRIVETKRALDAMGGAGRVASRSLKFVGVAGAIGGVLFGLKLISEELNKVNTIGQGAAEGIIADAIGGSDATLDQIDDIARGVKILADSGALFTQNWGKAAAALEPFDAALAGMIAGGNIDAAEQGFRLLSDALEEQGFTTEQIQRLLPEYVDGLASAEAQTKLNETAAEGAAGAEEEFAEGVDGATDALEEQETATEKAARRLQEYQDQLRAMTDPVFALESALSQVEDAQDAYNEAVEEYGKDSDEAADASFELARQLGNLEQAAIDGDLSFEDFDRKLRQWVESGAITEDQAADIRDRVGEAKDAAEEYQGDYDAHITLQNFQETVSKLDTLERRAIEAAKDRTATISYVAVGDVPNRIGGGGLAHGGLFPQDAQGFPGGGFVTGPGGPRDDLINARLSDGEFVVQAPAVNALGVDAMRAINAGVLPGSDQPITVENHIEIGGEVVRVVRTEIKGHDRRTRRGVRAGTGQVR